LLFNDFLRFDFIHQLSLKQTRSKKKSDAMAGLNKSYLKTDTKAHTELFIFSQV